MEPAPTILVLNHLAERHITAITNILPGANIICTDLEHAPNYISDVDILVTWGYMDIQPFFA